MYFLSSVTLLLMSFDCCFYGNCGRVLPMSVGVAVFLCIFAVRASMVCIHSLCQGVNGDWFVICGEDGPGNCGPKGVVESGHGIKAIDNRLEVVATCMILPD